ncbi:MAG TPA: 30S ribosome-binding factor RbfA [Vicinamibacterales bacterium]|jgi:ribosome-binding factor A|nr:30S ribosome-binding factor RbfA [Vicinamibacterales bacterium]
MPQGTRPGRVADQLRAEISDLLTREVHDPGIGFLTITHVKVTPDLQVARLYYTTLGDARARRETERALQRVTPFLRRHLGRRLRLKRVPELEFFFDEAIERGDRVERILQEITAGRAEPEPESTGGGPAVDGEPAAGHDSTQDAPDHDRDRR